MWRRKTRVDHKRAEQLPVHEPGFTTRMGTKFIRRFNIGNLSSEAIEQSLEMSSEAKDLDVAFESNAGIRDGVLNLGGWDELFSELSCKIVHENLIRAATVETLAIPNKPSARIKQETLVVPPNTKSIHPAFSDSNIHTVSHSMISFPAVDSKDMFIPAAFGNRIMFSQVLGLSHVRKSIDPNLLATAEYDGFLREAEIIKGLPANRCELMAVFRHIPIEIISHLRFLAERKVLVYQISTEMNRTQTRIHDLAAVLNNDNREIHLIAHRTSYRTVFLN
jgi:hypothetical protein